jgi:hypothetical protein
LIIETAFEIWSRQEGAFGNWPVRCPTLQAARDEAIALARGDMQADGSNLPGKLIFELDSGESLASAEQDGLYILTVTRCREPMSV